MRYRQSADKRNTADRAMSCAFVKERDADTFNFPDPPLSAHPHFVTRQRDWPQLRVHSTASMLRSHPWRP